MTKQEEIIDKIKNILRKDTRGLTIQEISDAVKFSRITASLALARLEGAGLIDIRVLGNCRLHYWRGKK